jgi:hypothetical protein
MAYKSSEEKREYDRRYAAENRERIQAYKRQWRTANRERLIAKDREYYAANRDSRMAKNKEYYANNRERALAQQKEYYAANRDRVLAQQAAYNLQTRGQRREWYDRSSTRIRWYGIAKRHGLTPAAWAALWQEQDGKCYLCNRELDPSTTDIDHDHSCCPQGKSCKACRRGLACRKCNSLIGFADDDPALLRQIADALEAAKSAVTERKAAMPEPLALF